MPEQVAAPTTVLRLSGDDLRRAVTAGAVVRAARAHQHYRDLEEQADDEKRLRNSAVREAHDQGCRVPELAKLIGVSRTTIYAILGTVDPA